MLDESLHIISGHYDGCLMRFKAMILTRLIHPSNRIIIHPITLYDANRKTDLHQKYFYGRMNVLSVQNICVSHTSDESGKMFFQEINISKEKNCLKLVIFSSGQLYRPVKLAGFVLRR